MNQIALKGVKATLKGAVKVGQIQQRVKDDVYIAKREVQSFGKKVAKAVKK